MQMRPGGQTGHTDGTDFLVLMYHLAFSYIETVEMEIDCVDSRQMLNDDTQAGYDSLTRQYNPPGGGCIHGYPRSCSHINPCMYRLTG